MNEAGVFFAIYLASGDKASTICKPPLAQHFDTARHGNFRRLAKSRCYAYYPFTMERIEAGRRQKGDAKHLN